LRHRFVDGERGVVQLQRSVAPLKPAQDALQLDNSSLTIDESVAQVLGWWQSKQVVPPVGTA